MNTCRKCGTAVRPDACWCPVCGTNLSERMAAPEGEKEWFEMSAAEFGAGAGRLGDVKAATSGTTMWTGPLKAILWLIFIGFCIAGFVLCISIAERGGEALSILPLIGLPLAGFFTVAIGMILIGVAEDLRICAKNSQKMVEQLNKK